MSNQITISGITGNPPYDVYVCDITNTYCYLITGSTTIPPTLIFTVPPPLDDVDSLLVKIIDTSGCTTFINYSCPPTPTPSITPTPTPTPTPTNTCRCYEITNTGITNGYFDYTDCFGTFHSNVFVNSALTVYFCGQNISNLNGVVYTQTQYCDSNTCPPPNINVCFKIFNYLGVPDWYCTLSPFSYFNGKPVYQILVSNCTTILPGVFVFWDNITNRWLLYNFFLGVLIQHLDNPGFLPISTNTPYNWINDFLGPTFKIISTTNSSTCP